MDVLTKLECNVYPIIPSREEDGYGLNPNIIDTLKLKGVDLIITVDNGVSASDSINLAKMNKIDVIITDHHKIMNKNTNIYALIHPETCPKQSPYKPVAGVGLAYILASQLAIDSKRDDLLFIARDLLCIGTIADMANLKGANRYWLKRFIPNIIGEAVLESKMFHPKQHR